MTTEELILAHIAEMQRKLDALLAARGFSQQAGSTARPPKSQRDAEAMERFLSPKRGKANA